MADPRTVNLPVLRLTRAVFDGLPEYSCMLPTGVVVGKRWRRNLSAYIDQPACWVVGEYWRTPEGVIVGWYRPHILDQTRAMLEV